MRQCAEGMAGWTALFKRTTARIGPLPVTLALLALALVVALSNLPASQRVFTTHSPASGNLPEFFSPQEFNAEVTSGWVFYDIAMLQEALRVSLRKDGQKYWVYFIPPSNPRHLDARCEERFCTHTPVLPEHDSTFLAASQQMAEQLRENLVSGQVLFVESNRPTNLPPPWYELGLLTLLASLALAAWGGLRRAWAQRDWSPGLLFAIFGAGLWTRWNCRVSGPLHANHHGSEELDYWLAPPESPFLSYYGRGFEAINDLIFAWLPRSTTCFMAVAAATGALSCVMAVLVCRQLTHNTRWGWFAGFALAVHPLAMRVGASESTFNSSACLLLLSLWGLLRHRREGTSLHLLIGHAALVLAVATHLLTLTWLALPLLILLAPGEGPRLRGRLLQQGIAALATALLSMPHAVYEWHADIGRSGAVGDLPKLAQNLAGYGNLLIDPAESPMLLLVLAATALTLLLWRRKWRVALLLVGLAALMVPFFLVHASFTDLVRYQYIPVAVLAVLAGVGADLLCDLLPHRWPRPVAVIGLVALLALNCLLLTPASCQHDAGSKEYEVLGGWANSLPQGGLLVIPDGLDAHVQFHAHFPLLPLQDAGRAYTILTIPQFLRSIASGPWPDEPVFYYRGLQLHWIFASDDESNPELHKRIDAIRRDVAFVEELIDMSGARHSAIPPNTTAPKHPGEFTELPANATIALYRLKPPTARTTTTPHSASLQPGDPHHP